GVPRPRAREATLRVELARRPEFSVLVVRLPRAHGRLAHEPARALERPVVVVLLRERTRRHVERKRATTLILCSTRSRPCVPPPRPCPSPSSRPSSPPAASRKAP